MTTPLKRCTRCQQEKPATLENFGDRRGYLTAWCRVCRMGLRP